GRRHTRFSRDWSSDVCSSDLRSSMVEVYDLQRAAGIPLETLKGWLLDGCEQGLVEASGTNVAILPPERREAAIVWRGTPCALVKIGRASCREIRDGAALGADG